MPKLDADLMHTSLQALCLPDEKYYHAVYGGLGKISKLSTSTASNLYGFVAITSMQRLIVTRFTMLGIPQGTLSFPLDLIKSVKIGKTVFGQNSVKIVIDNQGKNLKLKWTFANKVYAMGHPDQKKNLDALLGVLRQYEADK